MRRAVFVGLALILVSCEGVFPGASTGGDESGVAADSGQFPVPDTVPVPDTGAVARQPDVLDSVPADTLATLLEGLRRLSDDVEALRSEVGTGEGDGSSERLFQGVRFLGIRVVLSLLVLAVAWFGIRLLGFVMEVLAERMDARRMMVKRLVPIVRILAWTFVFYVVFRWVLGMRGEGLLAAGAAAGVAVGFAAQDVLKNIFGGILVILDQPFQVGDKVEVGGSYGEVISIGLRSTRIVTPDDNLVTVPNAQIVDGQVANANAGELNCQVVTELYLPGWVDDARAKQLAFEAAVSSKYVYLKKPVVVLVREVFKETFLLQVTVKAYVLDPRLESRFRSDVTERARGAFRDAGLAPADQRFGDAWSGASPDREGEAAADG